MNEEEIKKIGTAGNKKLKKKECPGCGHKSLVYKPPKITEAGFFPAYCDCLNCGYSTPVVDLDGDSHGTY